MNVKKGLVISILLLSLIGTGISWSLGNTLTPQEFADKDIDAHKLNPIPTGNKLIGSGAGSLFRTNMQIDTFVKNSETEYEEANRTIFGQTGIRQYVDCRDRGSSEAACTQEIKDATIESIVQRLSNEKDSLKSLQEDARKFALYASELQAGDIAISQAEINAVVSTQQKEP